MSCGFDKDRFVNLEDSYWDCVICQQVVANPRICNKCHNIFCKNCITEWLQHNKKCPFKCNKEVPMTQGPLPLSIQRIYYDLELKCNNSECQKNIKIKDLREHEMECVSAKCFNYKNCGKNAPYSYKDKPVCSNACYIYQLLSENPEMDDEELLKNINNFVEKVKQNGDK